MFVLSLLIPNLSCRDSDHQISKWLNGFQLLKGLERKLSRLKQRRMDSK